MYSGIAPILLSQLQSTNDKVYIPMVIGCLGNFCSEEKCRNYLLTNRVIETVLVLFNKVCDRGLIYDSITSTKTSWRTVYSFSRTPSLPYLVHHRHAFVN